MQTIQRPYEQFLRLQDLKSSTELMRARAVYLMGWAYILSQFINIFSMTMTYGQWTIDHSISVVSVLAICVLIHTLRYCKNFPFFAIMYSIFLLGGVFLTAHTDAGGMKSVGISSSLIPLLIVGGALNAFVGGWRMAAAYCVVGVAYIWVLYGVSKGVAPTEVEALTAYSASIFQRAMQASLALILMTTFSAFIVISFSALLDEMDHNINHLKKTNREHIKFMSQLGNNIAVPVNALGRLGRAITQTADPYEQARFAATMDKCVRHLTRTFEDAKDLSLLDVGALDLAKDPFNLRDLVSDTIETYKPLAARKALHLGTTFAAHLPEVYAGDARRLRQVLQTLLGYSLKATETGSVHLYIDGRLKGAKSVTCRVTLKDTSPGLNSDRLPDIFSRLGHQQDGPSPQRTNSGLNMALCYELVAAMGGTLVADSQLGTGTVFEINLEMQVPPSAAKVKPPKLERASDLAA